MILLLNKCDLFEAKIKTKSIREVSYFQDYTGPDYSYEAGIAYILKKFKERNKQPERTIFHHVTCATDTKNVYVVFNACKDTIIHNSVRDSTFVT